MNAITLTQALVRSNTINPPGNEHLCTDILSGLLERAGFSCETREFSPGRTSLVARIAGLSSARKPICFTGHLDVVPLGTKPWSHDPFGAEIVDGRLYGRGASDMKSGVASFVIAATQMAKQLKNGPGITLVITAAEETGCEGAFDLATHHKEILGTAGAFVVAEPTSNYPLVGHKGALWLKAKTHGVTAHGSMPEYGDNAIYKAARAVSAFEAFQFKEPAHPLMGSPTLNVGTIQGGINVNSVPDAAEIGIDIRTTPGCHHGELLQQLAKHLDQGVQLKPVINLDGVFTEPDNPWILEVFGIMAPVLGEFPRPRSVAFFTDASALTPALGNPPTIILGPGEPHLAHQTDEYCSIEKIEQAVSAYQKIIEKWYE